MCKKFTDFLPEYLHTIEENDKIHPDLTEKKLFGQHCNQQLQFAIESSNKTGRTWKSS